MSRLLTDEEVSRQLADVAGWRRNGIAIAAARTEARAKEQV